MTTVSKDDKEESRKQAKNHPWRNKRPLPKDALDDVPLVTRASFSFYYGVG